MIGFCLSRRGRLGPNAGFEIEVSPACGQDFAAPGAGQQQKPKDIRRIRIVVLGEGGRQPLKLGARQVALPLVFDVALDPFAGVVDTPAPLHGQRTEFRNESDDAVAAIGAGASW